ncbi:MAG: hypothetical protein FWE34_04700 [Defluviitaleaceae bacterium]|nr:hypothetical protein [Defluviitaleaceae bacterium]
MTNPNHYHIIYNPYASRGSTRCYLDAFRAFLDAKNIKHTTYETTGSGHATQLTRDIIANSEHGGTKYIVIMGGDGTVHEVVNGYSMGDDVVFGIIPAGTGNDVATMLNIPSSFNEIDKATENILKGNVKSVDLIVSENGIQSVLFFSYGMAAGVILAMANYKKKTTISYYRALLKCVFFLKASNYDVTLDGGETRHYKADFCAVHNCIHAGGGMHLIDTAVMDDSYLEFFVVKYRNLPRRILNFISILRKKIHLQPNVEIVKVKSAVIKTTDNNICCVDGENYCIDELRLEVKHKGIGVFVE